MVTLNCEETLAWGSVFTLLRYSPDPQLVHVVLFNELKEELSSLLFCHALISPGDEFGMVTQQRTFLFEAVLFYPWGGRPSSDGALEQIQRLTQGDAHPVCLIAMFKEHSTTFDTCHVVLMALCIRSYERLGSKHKTCRSSVDTALPGLS